MSKLSTFGDGLRILGTIGRLLRDERPLLFFGALSAAIMLTSEDEVVQLIARVAGDPELQKSAVGAARLRVKPMDLYFMLKG